MRALLGIVAAASAALATAAAAQGSVAWAKGAGVVGERFDGYLGYRSAPSAEVRRAVDSINIRRRALYSQLGSSKGVSPADVGVTAGCQLLATVAVGEYYQLGDNQWRRRDPGEGAPVPAYCRP